MTEEEREIRNVGPDETWASTEPDDAVDDENKRSASSIQFPYGDLNDAVELARAMYTNAGAAGGSWDQLASWLGYGGVSSGAFRTKAATARVFGLTERKSGGAILTTLGLRIVDPTRERAARATAFLNVPLYRAIYDRHLGMTLPPDGGLEHEMVGLGVSPKQKVRARQIFQRSADQAGFFGLGRNKLVMPRTEYDGPVESAQILAAQEGGSSSLPPYHPLVAGLLRTLPEPGTVWPKDKRQHWLNTFDHIFGLLYRDE
jgi:hypothetical protein